MLTVLNAIQLATEYFEKKEIQSARMNAEILLAHLLKCNRLDLYLRFDKPLSENEVNDYREMISRRGRYEPVQYIIGTSEFYGLTFAVNPSVLIPRPETEILVETIINKFKDRSGLKILDIGTGSGNISISLAKNLINTDVTAIDVSDEALAIAISNSEMNGTPKIKFLKKDIMNNGIHTEHKFDIIVSNPPYISEEDYQSLQKEITLYEPKSALSDYGDGLNFYKRISDFAKGSLITGGKIFFEMGIGQSNDVSTILYDSGFKNIQIVKDYQQIDRVIFGIKK
jgi:release factor glutamine methyltransferase